MKKIFSLLLVIFSFWTISNMTGCNTASEKTEETKNVTPDLTNDLRSKVPEENVKGFEEVIAQAKDDPGVTQLLGTYAFLNRHLELAAWCYSKVAEKKPDDAVNLSNLGLVLHEMYQAGKENKDSALLQKSIDLLGEAVKTDPKNASANNNLGYALYKRYLEKKAEEDILKAEEHLNKAVALDPENIKALSHLAEVLAARNKKAEAIAILNKVHRINPINIVFYNSITNLENIYKEAKPDRSYCDSINFNCEKCKGGIIGGLEYVTCEMEQQSAILACRDGKPFAEFYKCSQASDYPFLIPGLHSGVTILTPFGKLSIMLHGDGTVSYNLEIQNVAKLPDGVKLGVQGTYDPSSGQSDAQFNANVAVNLFGRGDATSILNKLDLNPASSKITYNISTGETKLQAESYGVTLTN